jgi:nicotinamide riboside kinase
MANNTVTTMTHYQESADELLQLCGNVEQLVPGARALGVQPDAGTTDWYRSLFQHLRPEVEGQPNLVVAVVGGTNTGKSMVFNQLAGSLVSHVTPRACRTKHPVCLVPRDFLRNQGISTLQRVFEQFTLRPWQSEDDALDASADSLLFVREDTEALPGNLILLDTPDMDGSMQEHWDRAVRVRQSADVLVGVLTDQKYNDAAVTRFFREAAASDKAVILVFNMVNWPSHQRYCADWLADFYKATGVKPLHVYAAPRDEQLGLQAALPFHPLSPNASGLREDLVELQFGAIKLRTFRGALRQVLNATNGLPHHLRQIESRSASYASVCGAIRDGVQLSLALPPVPSHLITDEIWSWLKPRRTRLDRWVHGTYSLLGRGVMKICRRRPPVCLEESYRGEEKRRLIQMVQEAFRRLTELQRQGNTILQQELRELVGGRSQEEIFQAVCQRYRELPLATAEYQQFVRGELDRFASDHPWVVRGIQAFLLTTAVVRPVLTVALFGGAHLAHELASQAATTAIVESANAAAQEAAAQVAVHSASQIAGEVVIGTATAVGGELAIGGGGAGIRALAARLFNGFYQRRAAVLAKLLDECLLGKKLEHLHRLAEIQHCPALQAAKENVRVLQIRLADPAEPVNDGVVSRTGANVSQAYHDEDGNREEPRTGQFGTVTELYYVATTAGV